MPLGPLNLASPKEKSSSRLGLISDTHGFLDPQVPALLQDVDQILHAGDIGSRSILDALNRIAPVTAVLGNTDSEPGLRDFEMVRAGEWRILVQHIVDPDRPLPDLSRRLNQLQPHAVVFGHTHRIHCMRHLGILFVNPGYAGRPRQGQERHIAILDCSPNTLTPNFLKLDPSSAG